MLPQQISTTDPAYITRVSMLAYSYWELRGSPVGSPDEDWFRAERQIEEEWHPYGTLRFDGQG